MELQRCLKLLMHLPNEESLQTKVLLGVEDPPPKTPDRWEKRIYRLEVKKEWNSQEQKFSSLEDILNFNNTSDAFVGGLLHSIEVSALDDQFLFEIGLKLRLGADPQEVIIAMEKLSSIVDDIHPQVFLQKSSILGATIGLLKSGIHSSLLVQLVIRFLQRFLFRLEHALYETLDQDLYTQCKKSASNEYLPHEAYLWKSLPQPCYFQETQTGVSVGVDIAQQISKICEEITKLIVTGSEPLFDLLMFVEAACAILIHPVSQSKDSKIHPTVGNCLAKLITVLHQRILSIKKEMKSESCIIDIRTLSLGCTVIRILNKTKNLVQPSLDEICPILMFFKTHTIPSKMFADFEELWTHCEEKLLLTSQFKADFEALNRVDNVTRSLKLIDKMLKEGKDAVSWIDSFEEIKDGLEWSSEPLCRHLMEEILHHESLFEDVSLLSKSETVLRSLLNDFATNIALQTLELIKTHLEDTLDTQNYRIISELLCGNNILEVLFCNLSFDLEIRSHVLSVLNLLCNICKKEFLKGLESWSNIIACFQGDPDFSDLLHHLTPDQSLTLSILNLWNKSVKTRKVAATELWTFICSIPNLRYELFCFASNPFEDLPQAKLPDIQPLDFLATHEDIEGLFSILLDKNTDTALFVVTIDRIYRLSQCHLDKIENSLTFQRILLKLFAVCLECVQLKCYCDDVVHAILQLIFWFVKKSKKAQEILQRCSIKCLTPFISLIFHKDAQIRCFVQNILFVCFWSQFLSRHSRSLPVLRKIRSHFAFSCAFTEPYSDKDDLIQTEKLDSKVEQMLTISKKWKELDSIEQLNSAFSLNLFYRDHTNFSLKETCWSEILLLMHCMCNGNAQLEFKLNIPCLVLESLNSYSSFNSNLPPVLWIRALLSILCSPQADRVTLSMAVRTGWKAVLLPLPRLTEIHSTNSPIYFIDFLICIVQTSSKLHSFGRKSFPNVLQTDIEVYEDSEIVNPVSTIGRWLIIEVRNSWNSTLAVPFIILMLKITKYIQNIMVSWETLEQFCFEDAYTLIEEFWNLVPFLISKIFHKRSSPEERLCNVEVKSYFLQILDILLTLKHGEKFSWNEEIGFAWLSKLTRDHEAKLRKRAFQILLQLCRPSFTDILDQVVTFWPELPSKFVHISLNDIESNSVRSLSLKCILQLINRVSNCCKEQNSKINSFVATLLQNEEFWTKVRRYAIKDISPSLKSSALSLLVVAHNSGYSSVTEDFAAEDLFENGIQLVVNEHSMMDSFPLEMRFQYLLETSIAASAAASLLVTQKVEKIMMVQDFLFKHLQALLDFYDDLEESLEASENVLFLQELYGIIRCSRVVISVSKQPMNQKSNPNCEKLSSLLVQLQKFHQAKSTKNQLILLFANLLSSESSCGAFLTTDEQSVALLRCLVSIWHLSETEERLNVTYALRNLLTFSYPAKHAFLFMHLHKPMLEGLSQIKNIANSTSRTVEILSYLQIFRHVVIASFDAAEQLLNEGIMDLLHKNWIHLKGITELRNEAKRLIKNILISAPERSINQISGSNGISSLLILLFRDLNISQEHLTLEVLKVVSSELKGTLVLLRMGLLDKLKELLHCILGSEDYDLGSSVYQVLMTVCFHERGRSALLSPRYATEFIKLSFQILSKCEKETKLSILCFLRNLSFSAKLSNHLLAQYSYLKQIHKLTDPFSQKDNFCLTQLDISAHAISLLWILASHGEKVKGIIKSMENWPKKALYLTERVEELSDDQQNSKEANLLLNYLNSFTFLLDC